MVKFLWQIAIGLLVVCSFPPLTARGQFNTVINVPPDVAPNLIHSDTQLNVFEGGTLPSSFDSPFLAGFSNGSSTNVEVNIFGGAVGEGLQANSGSTINIMGGQVDGFLRATLSNVNVSGGTVESIQAGVGSVLSVTGGEITSFISAAQGGQVFVSGGQVGSVNSGTFGAGDGGNVVISGGAIGGVDVINESSLDITGGVVEFTTRALEGGSLSISGGNVGTLVYLDGNSTVTISGGAFGRLFNQTAPAGVPPFAGTTTIRGSHFRWNGEPIADLDDIGDEMLFDRPEDFFLSGVLEDGSPFLVAHWSDRFFHTDRLDRSTLKLEVTPTAPVGPTVIDAATDPIPWGIRAGQTMTVNSGAVVGNNFNVGSGSRLDIGTLGTVGRNLEAVDAEVNILGSVDHGFFAYDGSIVNIAGGSVGDRADVRGSTVHIDGGVLGNEAVFEAVSTLIAENATIGEQLSVRGSSFSMTGGVLDSRFAASDGSDITLSGGAVGGIFSATDSTLRLVGAEFRLNGDLLTDPAMVGEEFTLTLSDENTLSGTLQDGTPFLFSSLDRDSLANTPITLVKEVLPEPTPGVLVASQTSAVGVRQGQTMIVDAGGELGKHFNAGHGSALVVQEGGTVDINLEAVGAAVLMTGGSVGREFDAYHGASVTVAGGEIDDVANFVESSLLINGGTVGANLTARSSSITVSVGTLGQRAEVSDGSSVTIQGGIVGSYLRSMASTVTLSGGLIYDGPIASEGSVFTMTGGTADGSVTLQDSIATVTGGVIEGSLSPTQSSVAAVSGGQIRSISLSNSSELILSGGVIGNLTVNDTQSHVTLVGGEFRLNGQPLTGLSTSGDTMGFTFTENSVLSGTLADGTPFIHASPEGDDQLLGANFLLQYDEPPAVTPGTLIASIDGIPRGLREGQELIVDANGQLPSFFVAGWGSSLELQTGATVEQSIAAIAADVTVSGAEVGAITLYDESTLAVTSGRMFGISARRGSEVTLTGGQIGLTVADAGSAFQLEGVRFILGNVELTDSLTPYAPVEITDRDTRLVVIGRDGKASFLELNSENNFGEYFDVDALLTITRVIPGDFNSDGLVNGDDLTVWQTEFGNQVSFPYAGADSDGDQDVDGFDFLHWQRQLTTVPSMSALPEPDALVSLLAALLLMPRHGQVCRCKRRQ